MADKRDLIFTLNGETISVEANIGDTLLDILRKKLGKKGVKQGCEAEGCGACTVIVNSENIYSCMYPAMKVEGKEVFTVDGLGTTKELDKIQYEFMNEWAFQCGYCTPGFIMAVKAMEFELKKEPDIIDKLYSGNMGDYIKDGLAGHICRCTGYVPIYNAAKKRLEEILDLKP